MAVIQLSSLADNMRGKLSKTGPTVLRQKKYRSENGAVINLGSQEAYDILNPRDYEKNPPKGTELANINSFAEASRLTTLIIRAGKYSGEEILAMTPEQRAQTLEYRTQLEQFKTRFMAQQKIPDPQAPLLPKTDPAYNHSSSKPQRRQYRTLNTFIRAILMQQLRQS